MTDPSPDSYTAAEPEAAFFSVEMSDEEALAYWPAQYNKLADRYEDAFEEILRLREFGEHYSGAAQHAWDRIAVLETALREIAEEQQKTLGWIRAHGIVFDGPLGTDPSNWENVAFSIYSDLCEVDSIARAALAAAVVSTEPTE